MSSSSPSISFSSSSLPVPSLVSYNIRSASNYSTTARSISRRVSISKAISSFISKHDIVCLQETHLEASETHALKFPGCVTSLNNLDSSHAGTAIIDSPAISFFHTGSDVAVPDFARGYIQLRRYSPTSSSHLPFQLFNVYFKSGDYLFNTRLIKAMLKFPNDVATFICGDFNFIENPIDSSSSTHALPSSAFINIFNSLKAHFKLYDPPHDSHTFYHLTSDPTSPYSWTSRIDRFLLPLILFNNPIITPTVSIPHHSTNLNLSYSASSFSDHLPIHVVYDNGTTCLRDRNTIPAWLAQSPEFAAALRKIWVPKGTGSSYHVYNSYKKALFKAAKIARYQKLNADNAITSYSQYLALYRAIYAPVQDLSFIQTLISRNPSLLALVKFTDGRWTDLGLLTAINDLRLCSFFSDSPPVHPVRDLANKAPLLVLGSALFGLMLTPLKLSRMKIVLKLLPPSGLKYGRSVVHVLLVVNLKPT